MSFLKLSPIPGEGGGGQDSTILIFLIPFPNILELNAAQDFLKLQTLKLPVFQEENYLPSPLFFKYAWRPRRDEGRG